MLGLLLIAASCNTSRVSNQVNSIKEQTKEQNQSVSDLGGNDVQEGQVTISITSVGFVSASVNIKKGTTVKFLNGDSKPHWPASNPHPTHTDYPGFDAGQALQPGESWTFTFDKVGTWKYHNHLNPARGGKITVTE